MLPKRTTEQPTSPNSSPSRQIRASELSLETNSRDQEDSESPNQKSTRSGLSSTARQVDRIWLLIAMSIFQIVERLISKHAEEYIENC